MALMSIADIQKELGVGRRLAERYAIESGACLPRCKGGPYKVRRDLFVKWYLGGKR
ncbi:MAG: hypothetical protein K6A91_06285 [Clostridia bacterium]|nr:hypothetical protein [Clostridia bacterium]